MLCIPQVFPDLLQHQTANPIICQFHYELHSGEPQGIKVASTATETILKNMVAVSYSQKMAWSADIICQDQP